ncbi:MAG: TM2 domain-containing protein [Bacteroidales bacterium]|jgi:hypothetical protein|nr:TM2 domain-containing protein [Bacteroidales bacterium]
MDSNQLNVWLSINAENFTPEHLVVVKEKLEKLPDDKLFLIQTMPLQKPTTMLIIAILLGWERFWLDDIGLGVLKVITGYGCGIWWLIDIFSAKDRTRNYNFKKFVQMLSFIS